MARHNWLAIVQHDRLVRVRRSKAGRFGRYTYMATPNEKLATSLTILQDLQKSGRRVFQSQELTRVHRERLLRNGFLQEVMKGWLISSSPGAYEADSTPWYAS